MFDNMSSIPVFDSQWTLNIFFNLCCCLLDYFILNCKLWDKFLISMIILILIISYILIFYRNFELIFEFMANIWPHMALICGRNVCFLSFWAFLHLIVIILIKENKKKLTLCQNNEKWTKILTELFKSWGYRHLRNGVLQNF